MSDKAGAKKQRTGSGYDSQEGLEKDPLKLKYRLSGGGVSGEVERCRVHWCEQDEGSGCGDCQTDVAREFTNSTNMGQGRQ